MIASDGAKVEVKNAPAWTPPATISSDTPSGTDNTNSNAGTGNTGSSTQNTGDSSSTSSGSSSSGESGSGNMSSGNGQGSGSSTGSGSSGSGTVTPPAPTETPSHTHNYSVTVVAPTCTTAGYTEHVCSCGNSYRDNETSALGHDWVEHSGQICIRSEQHTFCGECGMDLTAAGITGDAVGYHAKQHVMAGGGGRTYSQTVPVEWETYTEYTCSRCGAVK